MYLTCCLKWPGAQRYRHCRMYGNYWYNIMSHGIAENWFVVAVAVGIHFDEIFGVIYVPIN